MNVIRKALTGAFFTLAIAIPTAQAQEAQPAGPGTCAIQFAACLASGAGFMACSVAFAQCLAVGSSAVADRRDD